MKVGDQMIYYQYKRAAVRNPTKKRVMILEIEGEWARIQVIGESKRPSWVLKENLQAAK